MLFHVCIENAFLLHLHDKIAGLWSPKIGHYYGTVVRSSDADLESSV